MTARCGGLAPVFRLDDIKRQDRRTTFYRSNQRRVIANAQITFEPYDMNATVHRDLGRKTKALQNLWYLLFDFEKPFIRVRPCERVIGSAHAVQG